MSGFPSLEAIQYNGSLLVKTFTPNQEENYDRIFPNMKFTCNAGNITKWTFAAVHDQGSSLVSQLKLLRKASRNSSTFTYYHTFPALTVNNATSVAENPPLCSPPISKNPPLCIFELHTPVGIPFKAGDVLGIFQQQFAEYQFVYQQGRQFTSCNRIKDGGDTYSCDGIGDFGRPLVAVETGKYSQFSFHILLLICVITTEPAGCAQGFLHRDSLKQIMFSTSVTPLVTSPAPQPVAPDQMVSHINFQCSGNVTELIVGAKLDENATAQIKICNARCGKDDVIHTTTLTSFSATSYINVYECKLIQPVMVDVGNYIAIEYSKDSSYIYYQHRRWRNSTTEPFKDRPLVSVEVAKGSSKLLMFIFMFSATYTPFIL